MDAVKEAVLEQKIDDLTLRFDGFESRCERAEERNHREHREIREEIGAVRSGMNDGFRDLRSEMNDGFRDLRAEMNEGFGELRATFTAFNRTLVVVFGSFLGTAVAGVLVAVAAKLL